MKFLETCWKSSLMIILLINFILRLVIYWNTVIFNFSDYQSYLTAVDTIHNKGVMPLLSGNSLFAISYIGYFAKYILGSLDIFFVFNCLLGTLTTWLIALLTIRLTGKPLSGMVTAIILTFYTEFMVFSSVFYTPVLMLFILTLFTVVIFSYYATNSKTNLYLFSAIILILFIITFFFKPELVFFPIFLFVFAFVFIRKQRILFQRSMILVLILFSGILLIKAFGIYKKPEGGVIANDFIFFGHTDYGGDGGEGTFIYPENKARYEESWKEYCYKYRLIEPTIKDRNRFQFLEIKKFIIQHPLKWIDIQFTKFFRTFGVVPESTSFKILYTGLLKDKLWLTSLIVVAPVAIIILMFVACFDFSVLRKLFISTYTRSKDLQDPQDRKTNYFLYVYLLLFFYYIMATVFFGQYQERYRLPVMVVFIIPVLGYFIANFNKKEFLNQTSLIIRGALIAIFLTIWVFQAKNAISNKERFNNAMESVR
ncbi:MAG: hypothetical protein MUO72_14560 [Bacteroidales bacterium]|nr:hypothetical protein [Bacteroidales bacterium]